MSRRQPRRRARFEILRPHARSPLWIMPNLVWIGQPAGWWSHDETCLSSRERVALEVEEGSPWRCQETSREKSDRVATPDLTAASHDHAYRRRSAQPSRLGS